MAPPFRLSKLDDRFARKLQSGGGKPLSAQAFVSCANRPIARLSFANDADRLRLVGRFVSRRELELKFCM